MPECYARINVTSMGAASSFLSPKYQILIIWHNLPIRNFHLSKIMFTLLWTPGNVKIKIFV